MIQMIRKTEGTPDFKIETVESKEAENVNIPIQSKKEAHHPLLPQTHRALALIRDLIPVQTGPVISKYKINEEKQ